MPKATAAGRASIAASDGARMAASAAVRIRNGTPARRICPTWQSFPARRPRTISSALTRVVSSRPSEPRSLSPARLPASTAGLITSAIATAVISSATRPTRSAA